jgi:hypothetical protein
MVCPGRETSVIKPYGALARAAMVLELILGLGAVGGGIALMAGPHGEVIPLPMSALVGSPFRSYFAPGTILLAILGLGPLGVAFLAWRRHPLASFLTFVSGAALLLWLVVEIAIVGFSNHPPFQALYLGLGVALALIGAAWMRRAGTTPTSILAAFPLALVVAVISLAGILFPTTYERETANWTSQAIGQDWVDLLLAVPWLAITASLALRGSRRARFLLAGGFFYTLYTFAIYAFAIHFNGLFLLYCAGLGLSFFALAGMAVRFFREDVASWYAEPTPARTIGVLLVTIGALFAMAWLGEIIPATARGTVPGSVVVSGAPTNPVHVLDLSFVLPVHFAAGILFMRRRPAGYVLAPIVLGFGVLMAASIAGLMLSMRRSGIEMSWVVFGGMTLLSLAEALALAWLLRRPSLRSRRHSRSTWPGLGRGASRPTRPPV